MKSRIVTALGRGGKGKSWLLRTCAERALVVESPEGRTVMVCDGDPGNRTLANSLEQRGIQILQPKDISEPARVDFVRKVLQVAEATPITGYLDVGGNDQAVAAVSGKPVEGKSLARLGVWSTAMTERLDVFGGVDLTVCYVMTDDPFDLTQLSYVLDSPMVSKDLILVRNAGLLGKLDVGAADPWAAIETSPIYKKALKAGAKVLTLPILPRHLAHRLTTSGVSFLDAFQGKTMGGEPLSVWERQALQSFLAEFEDEIEAAGVEGLLS